jgi:hypothetical protein
MKKVGGEDFVTKGRKANNYIEKARKNCKKK